MIGFIASSVFMGFLGLILYIYFLKKGQFDNLEDVKYQLLRDEEDA